MDTCHPSEPSPSFSLFTAVIHFPSGFNVLVVLVHGTASVLNSACVLEAVHQGGHWSGLGFDGPDVNWGLPPNLQWLAARGELQRPAHLMILFSAFQICRVLICIMKQQTLHLNIGVIQISVYVSRKNCCGRSKLLKPPYVAYVAFVLCVLSLKYANSFSS